MKKILVVSGIPKSENLGNNIQGGFYLSGITNIALVWRSPSYISKKGG